VWLRDLERASIWILLGSPLVILPLLFTRDRRMSSKNVVVNSKIWHDIVNRMFDFEWVRVQLLLARFVPRSLLKRRSELS
jgi:hypothetical protein